MRGIPVILVLMGFLQALLDAVFGKRADSAHTPLPLPLQATDNARLEPSSPRVLLITFNPVVDGERGTRMIEYMGWNAVEPLVQGYISDVRACSAGLVNYQIVERIEVDDWIPLEDGYRYDGATFLQVMDRRAAPHKPDMMDYNWCIEKFDLVNRVMRNEIDEVWMFAFPYGGFYESRMVGEDAYWCNAPALDQVDCRRRFVMMGFNYERGVGEMEEAFGHRIESIMTRVYERKSAAANIYKHFITYDKQSPGMAQVGWMHYAPNSHTDYDWGNRSVVTSACDDWLNYPNLSGATRQVSTGDWGNGDIRAHHTWWFNRLPHVAGRVDGIRCNWWHYAIHLDPFA